MVSVPSRLRNLAQVEELGLLELDIFHPLLLCDHLVLTLHSLVIKRLAFQLRFEVCVVWLLIYPNRRVVARNRPPPGVSENTSCFFIDCSLHHVRADTALVEYRDVLAVDRSALC